MTAQPDYLENAKDRVLNSIVAQDILKELNKLQALVAEHGKRWIFELIQNALDVADKDGVDIEITHENGKVKFSHNGKGFNEEEIIHLIYHGSTKFGSKEKSGKLGTGFIATHLLSKQVKVFGVLNEKEKFEFTLNREAETLEDLTAKMQETWTELQKSRKVETCEQRTTYEYYLKNQEEIGIYNDGIDTIKEIVPLLLTFDLRLRTLTIIDDKRLVWSRNQSQNKDIVRIKLTENDKEIDSKISAVLKNEDNGVIVGIPLCQKDGDLSILDMSKLPKLYYPLPLIKTENFPFPGLISSISFIPMDDRDGVMLTKSSESKDVESNIKIIKLAYELFNEILSSINKWNYTNLYNIAKFPNSEILDAYNKWLDKDLITQLVKDLIIKICNSKVFYVGNTNITPKEGHIPVLKGEDDNQKDEFRKIWKLASELYPDFVPTEDTALIWNDIVNGWSTYLPISDSEEALKGVLTIENLADFVEERQNISKLQSHIINTSAINWLNILLELILLTKKNSLIDEKRILPDQRQLLEQAEKKYM